MQQQVEEQFLELHNNLVENVDALKFDIKMFLRQTTSLLNKIDDFAGYEEEECKNILNDYRSFMTGLFGMLENTTIYISEMMNKTQIASKLFSIGNHSSTSNSNTESESLLALSSPTETIFPPERNFYQNINNVFTEELKKLKISQEDENEKNTISNYNNNKCSLQNVVIKRPKIPCGSLDASIFEIGSIIPRASICSVDSSGQHFCICISRSPEFDLLVQSYSKTDRENYKYFPDPGTLFGVKVDDGVIRAVRCAPPSDSKVYLPDFGDVIELDKNINNIYHLTEKEHYIPGQAILCCLYNPSNLEKESNQQHKFLTSMLYKETSFKVYNVQDGILTVSMTTTDEENALEATENHVSEVQQNGNSNTNNKLTAEELEDLYDEPFTTSNALTAVLGYVPKDEQRICRFYNEETGTCFKGNNCRQEHIPMAPDYITKDKKPANAFAENQNTYSELFEPNTVLEVFITYIKNIECFYGSVIKSGENQPEPLIWADEDVPQYDYYVRQPSQYEIVLAKFKQDGNWYRAQVLDIDESMKNIQVFYLDYGNREYLPLKNIAKCTEAIAKLPRQVQPFRISCLQAIHQDAEVYKRGMDMLIDMLLNKSVKVCVESQYDDVFVRFIEEPYCDIPNVLSGMHCATIVNMF